MREEEREEERERVTPQEKSLAFALITKRLIAP